jgi:hypothetical protein
VVTYRSSADLIDSVWLTKDRLDGQYRDNNSLTNKTAIGVTFTVTFCRRGGTFRIRESGMIKLGRAIGIANRQFAPTKMEWPVYLHWPKVWNPILRTSLSMLIRLSSKTSAHWAAEKHWRIFSCILTRHALADNSQVSSEKIETEKPKECRIHLMAQKERQVTCSSLVIWKKTLRDIAHDERRSNLCYTEMFSEIPEIALRNMFTNWIMRLFWVMKKNGEYCINWLKQNRIILIV